MILTMAMAAVLAAQSGEARPPQRAYGNLNLFFSADDYPDSARNRRAEGTAGFRLEIDATGRVIRSTVTQSTGDPALDAQTCAIILGRVQYIPARDAAGRAVAGTDEGRVASTSRVADVRGRHCRHDATGELPARRLSQGDGIRGRQRKKGIETAMFSLLLAILSGTAGASLAADPQPARSTQDLYHWFTTDDYPLEAIRRHAEGVVGFRLTIDTEGAVSGCTVESSSGDADLDRTTCEILRTRAHYYPARDAAGRAIQGSDTGRVTWRLPPDQSPPEPLILATADIEGMIRMNGSQLVCRTTVNGSPDGPTLVQMCELLVGADGYAILQRTVAGTEFSAVLSIRPGDAGAAPRAADAPLFGAAAAVTVRPDGSVGTCAPLGGPARRPDGFARLPDPCALFPVGTKQFFVAEPSRTQPRSARLYLRYYLRPRQQLSAALPAPPTAGRSRANLAQYFSADDFPEPARLRRAEGTVGFRLTISAEGRVTDCQVTRSSGDSLLDETTCTILRERARYAPARDSTQRAVAGTDEGRVTWRLPEGYEPASLTPMRYVTRMRRVGPGDVRCTITENGVVLPGETHGACGDLTGFDAEALMSQPDGHPKSPSSMRSAPPMRGLRRRVRMKPVMAG